MNTDELRYELKQSADSWPVEIMDPSQVRNSAVRQTVRRRRVLAVSIGPLIVVGVAAGAAALSDHRGVTRPTAPGTRSATPAYDYIGPGPQPPAVIRALTSTGQRVDRALVLARVVSGTSATVRARLSFLRAPRGRVVGTAIVLAKPGTQSAAAPWGTGDYYRESRIAISNKVEATAPQRRLLTMTVPASLPAGRYPVLTVVHGEFLDPHRSRPGGKYDESGQLGIVIVTRA